MSDDTDEIPVWKYPYFSELEIRVLYPDLPYIHPGEEVAEGIVVRDFEELGPDARMFRIENGEILQLLPVRITDDSGIRNEVFQATISFLDDDEFDELEDESDDED